MVIAADPDYRRLSLQPWVYEFSNARLFVDAVPLYGSPFMIDDFGNIMRDESGNPMRDDSQVATGTSTSSGFPFGTGQFGTTGF